MNLARIGSLGVRVPPWFCVTTTAFHDLRQALGPGIKELSRVARGQDGRNTAAISRELISQISSASLDPEQADEILAAFDQHFGPEGLVAVRSSAISEDSTEASYAGQLTTFLNVGRDELLEKVLACVSSEFSPGCIEYRRLQGGRLEKMGCAVIVQQMVRAVSSGVLFTANPVNPDSEQVVITAAYGLGEGVVQDLAEADTAFLSHRSGQLIDMKVARKTVQVAPNPNGGGGTQTVAVSADSADKPVLDHGQLGMLHQAGRALEDRLAAPQDIEWAFGADSSLYLLQARPITALSLPRPQVFDSSNISENYRGATTALTFSYVRKYYEDIFVAVARQFGTPRSVLTKHRAVFRDLVAFLNGGLYYNLANWYRMFYLVPGFEYFARPFEHGVGLDGTPPQIQDQVRRLRQQNRSNHLSKCATWLRIVANFAALPFMMRRLRSRFEAFRAQFNTYRLERMSLEELVELFERVQGELAPKWSAPLMNDYYAFIFFFGLHKLARRWDVDRDGTLLSDIMRGKEELASVEPVRAILALAKTVKNTPCLAEAINVQGKDTLTKIRENPKFRRFVEELDQYTQEFGDRRFDELKLESAKLDENPEVVLSLLRNFLQHPEVNVVHQKFQKRDCARLAANRQVKRALAGRPLRKIVFFALSLATQKTLGYREYGRLVRSQRCGIERAILVEIGRRLAHSGVLVEPGDIYHLTIDEITSFAAGASVTRSLRELVAHRRDEYVKHRSLAHPLRVVGYSPVYLSLGAAEASRDQPHGARHSSELRGLGCSPGTARGRARVILDPSTASLDPGDILVTRATDPAWAFLMAAASGLVVERGNLLSHAAIIGRELGIPCVVGVPDATARIREGAIVTVNGANGSVAVREDAPSTSASEQVGGALAGGMA